DWLFDVFHLLSTKVHKGHRNDLTHLVERSPGDTHASGLRNRLQPRGNVHTLAEEVPGADHHVPNVDTHAEVDLPVRRDTCVRLGQSALSLHCALHGICGTPELR